MQNMMARANAGWWRQSALPKILSEQFWTRMPTMTRTGFSNERVRKKYDSVSLHPKTSTQSAMLATRARVSSFGYDAVNVWLARYLRDLPATRSPNSRPDGTIENSATTATLMANWTMPMMCETLDFELKKAM